MTCRIALPSSLALILVVASACVLDPKNVDDPDDSSAGQDGSESDGGADSSSDDSGGPGTSNSASSTSGPGQTTGTDGGTGVETSDSDTDTGSGGDGVPAFACLGNEPADPYDFIEWELVGDSLEITFAYGGGCQDHVLELCWGPDWAESFPVQVPVLLSHDAMGDDCEAYIQDTIVVDLVPLKEAYQQAYLSETGAMELLLIGQNAGVVYEF